MTIAEVRERLQELVNDTRKFEVIRYMLDASDQEALAMLRVDGSSGDSFYATQVVKHNERIRAWITNTLGKQVF